MRDATDGRTQVSCYGRGDSDQAIVSDLMSLIGHIQASMKLIEAAIAGEAPCGNQEVAADVVVLDDVTPRYLRANAALYSSEASLGAALHFLRDSGTVKPRSGEAGLAGARVRSIGRD